MKRKIPITVKCLALEYKAITKVSLRKAFSWAKANYLRYSKYEGTHWYKRKKEYYNGPYLENEFIFRGYIPLDSFKKKKGYNYIQSNQPINGTMYIYPQKCCMTYGVKGFGKYPNPYNFHGLCGIPGYTKVDVNYKL